ncbi:MAG TPA: hypothetical protein VK866_06870 [Acidimicrobiales bacterium]|nr:hypothetical protein [Acidimicrobiales bacterium]
MLPLTADTVRASLHVLGAALWVGGLVAALLGSGGPRLATRRLHVVVWAGLVLTLVTGVWALLAVDVGDRSTEYLVTLGVKLLVVAVSGAGAVVSGVTRDRRLLTAAGAVALVAATAALVLGVQLSG